MMAEYQLCENQLASTNKTNTLVSQYLFHTNLRLQDFCTLRKNSLVGWAISDEGRDLKASKQNIISHGNRSLLGLVTNQYCDHLEAGCTNNQKEDHSNVYWEHGKSYGYHQYL